MIRPFFIVCLVLFPFIGLFRTSPDFQASSQETMLQTIGLILVLALVNVWLAFTLAWWLMWTESRLKPWVEWLVFLPLFIPLLASLFGMYLVFAEVGLIGSRIGVGLALLMATLPYSIRLAYNGMYVIGRPMLEQSLGLPPFKRILYVLIPLFSGSIRTIILFTTVILLSQFALVQLIGAGLVSTVTTDFYQTYAGNDRSRALTNTWMLILLPLILYIGLGGLSTWFVRRLKGRLS